MLCDTDRSRDDGSTSCELDRLAELVNLEILVVPLPKKKNSPTLNHSHQ